MKTLKTTLALSLALTLLTSAASAANWTAGMTEGKVTLKSAGPITFGPDGTIFLTLTPGPLSVFADVGSVAALPDGVRIASAEVGVAGVGANVRHAAP